MCKSASVYCWVWLCVCVCVCALMSHLTEKSAKLFSSTHRTLHSLSRLVFVPQCLCVCVWECVRRQSHTSKIKTFFFFKSLLSLWKKINPVTNKLFACHQQLPMFILVLVCVCVCVWLYIWAHSSAFIMHACVCVFCGCLCIQVCVFALADGVNLPTQSVKPLSFARPRIPSADGSQ